MGMDPRLRCLSWPSPFGALMGPGVMECFIQMYPNHVYVGNKFTHHKSWAVYSVSHVLPVKPSSSLSRDINLLVLDGMRCVCVSMCGCVCVYVWLCVCVWDPMERVAVNHGPWDEIGLFYRRWTTTAFIYLLLQMSKYKTIHLWKKYDINKGNNCYQE